MKRHNKARARAQSGNDVAAELDKLEKLANMLDARFAVPGLGFRFGLDSLIGLIPGIGDAVSALPAAYIVMRARQLGASNAVQARMAVNAVIDVLVGSVPVFGDLFDVGFKANRRNVALLRRHLAPETDMIDITPGRSGNQTARGTQRG